MHLQSNSSAYPALIVNGGAALSADIQRWNNNAGTTLSVVDNAGNFGIRNSNPSYQLDVTGTGNFSQSIRFGDGTVQSTAYVNSSGELQSLITLNDSRASGLIASTSGVLQSQISDIESNGGSSTRTYNNVTSHFSMTENSDVVFLDTSSSMINVYLPTAVGKGGKELLFKMKAGSNSGVLVASGSQTIDANSVFAMYHRYGSYSLISDDSNWFIV